MNTLRLSSLTLGLSIAVFALSHSPSFADKPTCDNNTHCDHGDEGSGDGATVDLGMGMHSMGLPVTVNQDNSKKIRFNNTNFIHEIDLQFGVLAKDCVQPGLGDPLSEDEMNQIAKELSEGDIVSGGFVMERDRKKSTGKIVIEYTGMLGLTQVSYSGQIVPPAPDVTEDDDVFNFDGTIFMVAFDKLFACPNKKVTVTLNR